MTLDEFFKETKEAWEAEQKKKADEAKAREEEERRQRIEALRRRRAGKTEPAPPAAVVPPTPPIVVPADNFQIESLPDRYRLHNIQYRNGLYVVDWSKSLLHNGMTHRQQDWIALTQDIPWKIPDLQLYHATLSTLYRHRDHAVEEQKKLVKELQQLFRADFVPAGQFMSTSSRIKYAAPGADTVTHDWGYPSAREHSLALVGPDCYINSSSGLEAEMEGLLGSRDLAEIEKVYEWVSGKKPYLWRFNQAPAQATEQAAVLGCSIDDLFIFNCDIIGVRSSRGVVASRAEK